MWNLKENNLLYSSETQFRNCVWILCYYVPIFFLLLVSFVFCFCLHTVIINSNNESGHSFTFCHQLCRSFTNGQWYCFNDQSVTRVSLIAVCYLKCQTPSNSLYSSPEFYYSGSEINFFQQAPTGDRNCFFSHQMGKCGR